jgi:hypothetical protein
MAQKIMIIRHGEKPEKDDGICGVDENGKSDNDELSVRGWQRAGALVRFFAPLRNAFAHKDLAVPSCLFAPRATKHVESVRSEHTLLPLSRDLSIAVDTRFHRDETSKVAKAACSAEGIALIAWEHDRIPEIVAAITGRSDAGPEQWPDGRFDLVWILDQSAESKWSLTQVPQMVLPGDLSEIVGGKAQKQKSRAATNEAKFVDG